MSASAPDRRARRGRDALGRAASLVCRDPRAFARYFRRYAAAARAGRRLGVGGRRDPAAAFALAERFTWADLPIRPNQVRAEIVELLELLVTEQPRIVVEIGTLRGGTLFLWTRVAAPDATVVTIDNAPAGAWSPMGVLCRSFALNGQRVVPLLGVDSQDVATVSRVREAVGGASIDFLFIDGDHSYDGVRRDFELYTPLVRSGGLVALHDISRRATSGTEGVARFWSELAAGHEVQEIVADEEPGFGIGLYRAP